MINRRGLLTGLISVLAAPAIVRIENIMPVKATLYTGAGHIWTPRDIPGCIAWWRYPNPHEPGITFVAGQSGNGNHLVGHIISNPPILDLIPFGQEIPPRETVIYNRALSLNEQKLLDRYLKRG